MKALYKLSIASLFLVIAIGCTKKTNQQTNDLSGTVRIDGSSTVFPISEAMAEEFGNLHRKVRVTVGVSGTGGGFKKFARGDIDISDASRPIKAKEAAAAKQNNLEYQKVPVAYDGISVVVNPQNDFASELTIKQLQALWQKDSKIKTWQDFNPAWPNKTIKLYGPGPDSGTFDYFNEAVLGKSNSPRADYVSSEDDNVLVKGVAGDKYALGYFGYAYFTENKKSLKSLAISKSEKPALHPNSKTIMNGTYALARPVFVYVSHNSAQKKEVTEFIKFYLKNAEEIVPQTGYIALNSVEYQNALQKFIDWSTKTEITMN